MKEIALPTGIEDFAKLRRRNYYYVDKTGFIEELLRNVGEVSLFTRPRRFGKTLTMYMLSEFFDIRKDSTELFEGLEVLQNKELCSEWMNQWPVLFLTMKNVEGRSFQKAYSRLKGVIEELCLEHEYLLESPKVKSRDKKVFKRLMDKRADPDDVESALKRLTRMLKDHYGKKVILLIDEYDVPIAKASEYGYYDEMMEVMRSLYGEALKTNPSLEFAVLTGCLRITKESIFTGLNNFDCFSVTDNEFQTSFGFTEPEVRRLFEEAGLEKRLQTTKEWYNGYVVGATELYCPWDVVKYVRALVTDPAKKPQNYWTNTSHNDVIRHFLDNPRTSFNKEFNTLMSGGIIQKPIREDLTYDVVHSSPENLWSLLLHTGYLTVVPEDRLPEEMELRKGNTALRIPNEEVRSAFGETIARWFDEKFEEMNLTGLPEDVWNGDAEKIASVINEALLSHFSYYEHASNHEYFYQTFMVCLLTFAFGDSYDVTSNLEMGEGRPDIIVTDQAERRAAVFELKKAKTEGELKRKCSEALAQISETKAVQALRSKGYHEVICYGIAFHKKTCIVERGD